MYIEGLSTSFSKLAIYSNKLEKDIMDLENNWTNLSNLKDYSERDLRDARDLLPTSTQKFVLLMLNQSRGTDSYNTASLLGYLIFASLRNRFAMGLCYLIREMDKLNKQRLEKERILREIKEMEEKEQLHCSI